jgi:hypothetical protein
MHAQDGPPVYARVTKARTPISYETTALPLQVGDVIRITRRRDGRGYGELTSNGKVGNVNVFYSKFEVESVTTSLSNFREEIFP